MTKQRNSYTTTSDVSLSEGDYLLILGMIHSMNHCQSQSELDDVLMQEILPAFDCQGSISAFVDTDIGNRDITSILGIPSSEHDFLHDYLPNDRFPLEIFKTGRSVVAYDLDLPRQQLQEDFKSFMTQTGRDKQKYPKTTSIVSAMLALDMPSPTVGIAIHKHHPTQTFFTARDKRMMELFQPHLLHAIRSVAIKKRLSIYEKIIDNLIELDSPVSLLTDNGIVIKHNNAFKTIPGFKHATSQLPDSIREQVIQSIRNISTGRLLTNETAISENVTINDMLHNLSVTRLHDIDETIWLLKATKIIDIPSLIRQSLLSRALTNTEVDICLQIHAGSSNTDIIDKKGITENTLKTHIKHIHQKLAVSNRVELLQELNQIQ